MPRRSTAGFARHRLGQTKEAYADLEKANARRVQQARTQLAFAHHMKANAR